MDQDALDTEVGLGLRDIVLDKDPATPPLKGHSPQFSANVRFAQMAGWTKMPLGMEVGLDPDKIVLDGVPATRKRGTAAPLLFGPCLRPRSPISATAEHLFALLTVLTISQNSLLYNAFQLARHPQKCP